MGNAPEAAVRPCPELAELAAFLCDELPHDVMDDIGAHVSGCEHCDAVIRRMSEATNATSEARRARAAVASAPDDPAGQPVGAAVQAPAPVVRSPVPAADRSAPSQLGQYRIGEQLGRGGMGAVYRAEHLRLKKPVAVKILSPDQTRDRRSAARFQLEMEVVGRLDHPNIVRATDAGEADGVHFLVMELIEGTNLARLLLLCGPLPVPDACELVRQAAVGLQHAHEHGLVHRDVKPSNLMLSNSGQVKLLDLGLALLRANGPDAPDLTGAGEVMGTAEYMAPEQWAETHSVDIRADIYSLGCTLYALLTGDPPFTGSGRRSFLRLMSAHQQEPVRPITDYRPDVPPPLCDLIGRMLAKSPDDRPSTPGEVADALEQLATGAHLSALLPSTPGPRVIPERLRPRTPTPAPSLTPGLGSTVSERTPARRRLLGAALVVVLVASAMGIYYAVSAPALTGVGAALPVVELPRSEQDPRKWRNLLAETHGDRLPRLWRETNLTHLSHDRKKEVLKIESVTPALIRLGDAPHQAYKLHITFRQPRWTGGFGVYFGGSAEPEPGWFVFQFLTVQHVKMPKDRGNNCEFALKRFRGKYPLAPDYEPAHGIDAKDFQSECIASPGNTEQLLELEVKRGGLAVVRWNGIECPKLVGQQATDNAARQFRDGRGTTGEFGIYCVGATVTVETARYVATE